MLLREPEHLVEVDEAGLTVDAVGGDRVQVPREVHLVPVRQVAAVVEPQGQERVAGLEAGEVDRHVRLRAGMGLHVRVLGPENRLRALDRKPLDLVDHLAAAVVPLSGIPLGVLVRRHRPGCLEHRRPGEVLGRDQLDLTALAPELALDQPRDLRIDVAEPGGTERLERNLGQGHRRVDVGLGIARPAAPRCRGQPTA